jgi:hypothetical protein
MLDLDQRPVLPVRDPLPERLPEDRDPVEERLLEQLLTIEEHLTLVGETGVPTRAIAEAIERGLGVPVKSVPAQDAAAHFGWIGAIFAMDLAGGAYLRG